MSTEEEFFQRVGTGKKPALYRRDKHDEKLDIFVCETCGYRWLFGEDETGYVIDLIDRGGEKPYGCDTPEAEDCGWQKWFDQTIFEVPR